MARPACSPSELGLRAPPQTRLPAVPRPAVSSHARREECPAKPRLGDEGQAREETWVNPTCSSLGREWKARDPRVSNRGVPPRSRASPETFWCRPVSFPGKGGEPVSKHMPASPVTTRVSSRADAPAQTCSGAVSISRGGQVFTEAAGRSLGVLLCS